ncbi:uncharacterized protein LOC107634126 isoform X2 [Arachis ipaensis]|uniref:uncharacterized protein LOC107634126 isoform X2 n=1 Tax=Arachis ipaensis TaxID=130454 RepID=UPI0007AF42E2|nr:uncharacterized protein LOC107634126 isoform X2 [Arachis ipaensis]XP_025641649.1 uncharacterized protein LOC112736418 isoform X2 [Arachis hypogaea]QHN98584.1 uncharacterized protein DS421_13g390800 [Arachis hypogaea]
MDYNVAALKVVCSQLKHAREVPNHSQSSYTLGGILFQRVWLQGVLVSDTPLVLDDGTGVIELSVGRDFLHRHWQPGMYVMVVGGYVVGTGDIPMVKRFFYRRYVIAFRQDANGQPIIGYY